MNKFVTVATAVILFGFIIGIMSGSLLFKPQEVVQQIVETFTPSPSPIPAPGPILSIMLTGDIMLGRGVNRQSLAHQDFTWPFTNVRDVLAQADITVSNLENAIIADCPIFEHGFTFCSPSEAVMGLTYAGIDIVSLANNHSSNFGAEGIKSTESTLRAARIGVIGLGQPEIILAKGIRIAFLGYNDIGNLQAVAKLDSKTIEDDVKKIRDSVDLLFIYVHWGVEYQRIPTDRQITVAHQAIDAGADGVIGHHPHWVQTKEMYKGKPIYYSLGNFIFDQEWSQETKEGLAIRLNYTNKSLSSIDEMPVLIQDYGQPHWMNIEDSRVFLTRISYLGSD